MKLFPHVLVRVAGYSYDHLAAIDLCFQETREAVQVLISLRHRKEAFKCQLSTFLLDQIRVQISPNLQNKMQNVRRDIFNGRKVKDKDVKCVYEVLQGEKKETFLAFFDLINEEERRLINLQEVFKENMAKARFALKTHFGREIFQKGLALSSAVLFDCVSDLLAANPNAYSKKQMGVEASLLKYFARMVLKTSPFSTFTNVSITTLDEPALLGKGSHDPSITSSIRISNQVFHYLKRLISTQKEITQNLEIRLNPSITATTSEYTFLTYKSGKEIFQRMPISDQLEVVLSACNESSGRTMKGLVNAVLDQVDESKDRVEKYLRELIAIGFLESHTTISGLNSKWNQELIRLLVDIVETQPNGNLSLLLNALINLQLVADQLPEASAKHRNTLIEDACSKLIEVFSMVVSDIERNQVDGENLAIPSELISRKIFFEDTIGIGGNISVVSSEIIPIVSTIDGVVQRLSVADPYRSEKDEILRFYLTTFPDQKSVGILDFYEAYARNKEERNALNNYAVNDRPPLDHWKKTLGVLIKRLMADSDCKDELNIPLHLFNDASLHLQNEERYPHKSIAAHLQLFKTNGSTKAVLNSVFPGNGKMFSRFLHLFPPKVTEDLRQFNHQFFSPSHIVAEINDGSHLNVNMHPPLTTYEIQLPKGNCNLSDEFQVPINKVILEINDMRSDLGLFHRDTGQPIHVLDLGYQATQGRTQLFQLLDKFSPASYVNTYAITEVVMSCFEEERKDVLGIRVLPRIVIQNNVVLQRKSWFITKQDIPYEVNSESDIEYFISINTWRKSKMIPERVFFWLDRYRTLSNNSNAKLNRYDYKPQFINFSNPLFVGLFRKLVSRMATVAVFEEMLPDCSDMLTFADNSRFVAEYLLQWNHEEVTIG